MTDNLLVSLIVTVVLAGGCSWMTGQALANTWRPIWQMVAYGLMLGAANRFVLFALFKQDLLSGAGYAVDTAIIVAIGLFSFRVRKTTRMVTQYPWLYERATIVSWRPKSA